MKIRAGLVRFAVLASAFGYALLFAGYIVDDAYISFRYAHNLASGRGLTFNAGEFVEGYTNFSWVLLAAACEVLGTTAPAAIPVIGLALHVLLAAGCIRASRACAPESPSAGLWAGALVALQSTLAFYSVTGLETPLFALLWTAAAWALCERRPLRFAWLVSAAFLTRPEAGLLGVIGTGCFGLWCLRDRGIRRSEFAGMLAVLTLAVGGYLVFKLSYFGAMLPNTLHAKWPEPRDGLRYVGLQTWSWLGIAAIVLASEKEAPTRRLPLALVAAQVAGAALSGGDWMPLGRLVAPYFPLLAIVADRSLARSLRERRWLWTLAAVLPFAIEQASAAAPIVRRIQSTLDMDEHRAAIFRDLGARGARSIAAHDIGLLSYSLPDVRVVDLGGLTDRRIGWLAGGTGEKHPTFEYLESLAPDRVLIASGPPGRDARGGLILTPPFEVERYILSSAWLRTHYEHARSFALSRHYHLHVFQRLREPRRAAPRRAPRRRRWPIAARRSRMRSPRL